MKKYMFRLFLRNKKSIYLISEGTDIKDAYLKIHRADVESFNCVIM